MDVDIRLMEPEHLDEFFRLHAAAFSEEIRDEDREVWGPQVAASRTFAAFEGERMVGSTGAADYELTVPGGRTVPCAGVIAVGVLPTHRRRGILRNLTRTQLDDIHERGQPMAYLWASEASIYQRFGYGIGALMASFDIRRTEVPFVRPVATEGQVRLVDKDEAMKIMPTVYEAVRPRRAGFVTRDDLMWTDLFRDPEHEREGGTPLFFAVHEGPTGPDGYVAYRSKEHWAPSIGPDSTAMVEELLASTDEAYAALWRYLLDLDLVRRVKGFKRPADEPLLHMLLEPRALDLSIRDGTWLRLVDVRTALESRGYVDEGGLVLDLRDPFCSWNEGRWELEAGPEGGSVKRSDANPDLTLHADDLAAMYLGAVRPSSLARAGRVEGSFQAVARADALFATAEAPWCPHIF
ncbi:MAG TPA: GNAT family N-acetyltransferase [Actinomycetota bacterium]|nr:GNAT family N-acetyltransferase [Actinomycetota bacterium]